MKEKIKLYVSKKEHISGDLLFADDTTLTSYFNETECELITEDCELCSLEEVQNQKAIECLKEVRVKEMSCNGKKVPEKYIACFNGFIDNKIKELEIKSGRIINDTL